jgi:hypothetical protein
MEFHFTAISKITLTHEQGAGTSTMKHTEISLEVSKNLDKKVYIDFKGYPKKDALKPISNAFIHGLVVNMRMGASKGWWSEGEHMQYVIDQLQKAFVHPAGDPIETIMEQ